MAKIRKINVSEIRGVDLNDEGVAVMPAGTIVVYENNGEYVLRVHDGVTNGGVALSAGETPVIFNGKGNITFNELNDGIAALFNSGDVYITNGKSLRFTGLATANGNSESVVRFWNAEGRHSTPNDPTELVTLDVGNDAAPGSPTEGFLKIITEKETGGQKEWKFDANGVLHLPAAGDIVDSNGNSVLGGDDNIWVQTFVSNAPTTDFPQIATSVEYDADGNIIALFNHYDLSANTEFGGRYYSVGKYTPTGSKIWTARFVDGLNTDGWGLAVDIVDGWIYVAGRTGGGSYNYEVSTLAKLNPANGSIEWNRNYDFGFNSSSAVVDVDSDGNPIMVGYVDVENNDILSYLSVTKVNKADGTVTWTRKLDGQADEDAYGMAVGPAGEVVAVGYISQLDTRTPYSVTPRIGSGVDVLVINRSDLGDATFTDAWEVAGTGITGYYGVTAINAYSGLTGTVREGSGATFDITIGGDGSITNPVVVAGGGANYLPGHKIKIPYTVIGGSDINSDIILTVTETVDGAISSVAAGYYGAGSGTPNIYYAATGTNYQTGSGLEFNFFGDAGSTYTEHAFDITAGGSNYVQGDVVTIPGTQLGGTTPENDLITTVGTTDGAVTQFFSFSGNAQTTTYRIRVADYGVDFGGVGSWTLNSVSTDATPRMVAVKYDNTGAIQWQKAIQFDEGWGCSGADADIDSNGNVYICGQYDIDGGGGPTNTGMGLVKLDSTGAKQWSRRVVGDCISTSTSIVVGPDDKLYMSGVNGNAIAQTFTWVVAKFDFDGLLEWQRFVENAGTWTFAGSFFGSDSGGSNIAVRQDYVALAGGFGNSGPEEQSYAAVLQVPATGNVFAVGNWNFEAATLTGTLDATASDITVVNAGLIDSDNELTIVSDTAILETDVSNFLIGTLFTAPSGNDSLVNGAYSVSLGNDGTLTLPAGGNITEGVVTSNPTIQITPASPDVASQKLVIKGGSAYTYTDNGITISYNDNTALVGDTLTFFISSTTYADQTLYWWIYPAGAGIGDSESGTVVLSGSSGDFSILIDSDDYEFRVRVSPENDNYDPANVGVETGLINADAPTFDAEHHLHLTTGDLAETSIFLGTDNHNVRTTVNGGIQITTPNTTNNVWQFGNDGGLTFPDITVQTTAYVPADNVTKTSGTWTVTPGDTTYSFQVPLNGVYQLWVRGNIQNGIISYTATAAVTNGNVPVLGTQYAWNYTGAGNPILFTSIPNQFIGTEGAISTVTPSVGTSTNTFVFGIDNNTENDVTVEWGYTKIS